MNADTIKRQTLETLINRICKSEFKLSSLASLVDDIRILFPELYLPLSGMSLGSSKRCSIDAQELVDLKDTLSREQDTNIYLSSEIERLKSRLKTIARDAIESI